MQVMKFLSLTRVWYDQVIAIHAFVFADCIFVMHWMVEEEGNVGRG